MAGIGRSLSEDPRGDRLSPAIVERLQAPTLTLAIWLQAGLATGVVTIMTLKPDFLPSLLVLILGAIVGWAIATIRGRSPMASNREQGRGGAARPVSQPR